MESGTLDANLRLDPAASKLDQLVIAHDGTAMDRRQPQDIHVPLYNNAIGPGAARVVHYRFKVPADAKGSVTLSAGGELPQVLARLFDLRPREGRDPASGHDHLLRHGDAARRARAGRNARDGRQARQPRLAREGLDPLERLRHRPPPAGRPQGRLRGFHEGGRDREGQARRSAEPRAREDQRGRPAAPRSSRSPRPRRAVPAGRRRRSSGRSSRRKRAGSTTRSPTSSAWTGSSRRIASS